MEIQLNQVCPNVFEGIKINSEVWNSNLLIENEGRYQILAQSGRGKTSFLYFLLGLRNDYTGEIQINQKRIQDIKEEEWVKLRKTKMTSIFQDLQLIGHLTVAENIRLIPEFAKGYDEDIIQKIVAKLITKNIGILITDHNVQETLAITDRTYLMFEGSILKHGIPEDLANDEMVRKVYLGQNFELRKKKISF